MQNWNSKKDSWNGSVPVHSTSNSLKATTVTISIFKSDPGYDYKLKYIPAP